MQILFYDGSAPALFSLGMSRNHAFGGAETSIIRIAHGLAPYHQVYVAQHLRRPDNEIAEQGVQYISFDSAHLLKPDVVILLRNHRLVEEVAKRFPSSRLLFWQHNTPPNDLFNFKSQFAKYGYEIIAISNYHHRTIVNRLNGKWWQRLFCPRSEDVKVHMIYAAIEDDLHPDETKWNPFKLLFMSSPRKGLTETLDRFKEVLKHDSRYHLYVTNPGYYPTTLKSFSQVTVLGSLPLHSDVINHIRESFCVFYPQRYKAETFGLVYAESNAVGTPVLAHPVGAASEILSDPSQLVDGGNAKKIIAKLDEWQKNRPTVRANPAFRVSNVIKEWLKLLTSTQSNISISTFNHTDIPR